MTTGPGPVPSSGRRGPRAAQPPGGVHGSRAAYGDPQAHLVVALLEDAVRCLSRALAAPDSAPARTAICAETAFLRSERAAVWLAWLGLPDDAGDRLIAVAHAQAAAEGAPV